MIDNRTYRVMHPESSAFRPDSALQKETPHDPFPTQISHDAELDELTLKLLPAKVSGFHFHEKKWGK